MDKDLTLTVLTRLLELEAKFTELKALYKEYDLIVLALKNQGFREETHEGRIFTLVDNYIKEGEEINTAYRVAFIKRYEVKIKGLKE